MQSHSLKQSVRIETFKILNNRRTPTWALSMLVIAFAYFNWEINPTAIALYWVLPNTIVILGRQFFLYPFFDNAKLTGQNVNYYLKLYALNVGTTAVLWALILPYFFYPEDPVLLLVFVFCYFIVLVSGTLALCPDQIIVCRY